MDKGLLTQEEIDAAVAERIAKRPKRGKQPKASPSHDKRPPEPTDDQIAEAFAEEHRNDLRYVAAWGKWFEWNGKLWREDDTLRAFDLIRKTCKAQGIERAGMAKMVAAVHTLVRADRRIAATVDQWDADLWLLNTPDGIVDLRAGTVGKSDPRAYCTKITAVGPRGDCPLFITFLTKIMGGDEELIAYVRRMLGYCLTGDTSEQALFFNHGGGQNGKTTLMSTVSGILADYGLATPIETFTESKTDRHPTELARMRGARLVTATETEAGRHWGESRLKEITGGEKIPARYMHQNFFEYLPQLKPVISGNDKPRLRSVGVAMRRRVNMIPFLVTISDDEKDPLLKEKLKAEWPAILQWMIVGCLDWQKRGLDPPAAVTKATDDYFRGQDSLSIWLDETCERNPNAWTKTTALFAAWKAWAEKAGVRYGDITSFGDALKAEDGFIWKHTNKGNGYQGLRIRQDDDLPL